MRELILYVLQRSTQGPNMGGTKLNKVLFRSDFGAFLNLGEPITGHPYFKLKNGPAPRHRFGTYTKGPVTEHESDL